MQDPNPLKTYTVTLAAGTFVVQARSLQAALLRAQADALDSGALEAILAPLGATGPGMAIQAAAACDSGHKIPPMTKPEVVPGGPEQALTAKEICTRLAKIRGKKAMNPNTLRAAIRKYGLPAHENPFGRGFIFYWSEVETWLQTPRRPERPASTRIGRGPGRPRKGIGRP